MIIIGAKASDCVEKRRGKSYRAQSDARLRMLKAGKRGSILRLDIQKLLNGFEAPAVFYRENTVRYFNEAAKILFPEIKEGKGMPERSTDPDFPFRAEVNQTDRGVLFLFRPRLEEKAQGDLAAVSEELRRCLTGLTMAVDEMAPLVREHGEEESADRMLGAAAHSLYRLRRLTDHSDILRQLEGRSPGICREAPVDLADLCRAVGDHTADLARQAGFTFRQDLRETSLITLGDGELLQRMILNLISNALKAVKGDGGEVGLRLERQGDRALITVWDTGAGMEEERLAAIFRPQRRRRLTKPEEGAGLGLRLVRETAVLHGGRILAEARPEGGVLMKISLPIRPIKGGQFRSTSAWGESGFDLVLVELSDVLPSQIYTEAGDE